MVILYPQIRTILFTLDFLVRSHEFKVLLIDTHKKRKYIITDTQCVIHENVYGEVELA
jgi:hypothetical protein